MHSVHLVGPISPLWRVWRTLMHLIRDSVNTHSTIGVKDVHWSPMLLLLLPHHTLDWRVSFFILYPVLSLIAVGLTSFPRFSALSPELIECHLVAVMPDSLDGESFVRVVTLLKVILTVRLVWSDTFYGSFDCWSQSLDWFKQSRSRGLSWPILIHTPFRPVTRSYGIIHENSIPQILGIDLTVQR